MGSAADVAREMDAFVALARNTVILEVTHELKGTTPVLTGFARASWVPGIGEPSTATGAGASAAGEAEVIGNKDPSVPANVTNNADHIEALNRGHSKQAPAKFVEMAIDKGVHRAVQTLAGGNARDLGGKFV